jgi:hypothetical protein
VPREIFGLTGAIEEIIEKAAELERPESVFY